MRTEYVSRPSALRPRPRPAPGHASGSARSSTEAQRFGLVPWFGYIRGPSPVPPIYLPGVASAPCLPRALGRASFSNEPLRCAPFYYLFSFFNLYM